MKKLLVAGHENIFQITKSFRNKEHESSLHNPEFTILEWYRAFASYEDIMKDTEELVCSLAKKLLDGSFIQFEGHRVDVGAPWDRIKVKDLFKQYANISYEDFEDVEKFRKVLKEQGYKVTSKTTYDDMFFMVFLNVIEPNLGMKKPVIVYEYPASMAALSKKCEHDPRYAERFEVYIAGMELCNAFTELNDPQEQKSRLEIERKERQALGKEDYTVDQSFIRALEFGMPPSGGIALGVDRLAMLLTGVPDIRDLLYFPHRDL
jgi:EF-P lysine aminoacylase GenX